MRRKASDETTVSASKCREANVDFPDPAAPISATSAPAGTWIVSTASVYELAKSERPAGECRPLKRLELDLDLAGVLAGLSLVGSRRAAHMEQVLRPAHTRYLEN